MSPSFDDYFELARTDIFRLETLQTYGNSGEDAALAAFEAGEPHLITPGKREWIALVTERTAAGCTMHRVHVVTEPITDYLRFELNWGYAPNDKAGERIGIIPVPPGEPWPTELPERTDFWLFDLTVLYVLRYDQNGAWHSTEQVTEPGAIEQARRWREAALRLAVPWRDYVAAHPAMARIVSQTDLTVSFVEGAAGDPEPAPCAAGGAVEGHPSGDRPVR
ncbi:MAG: DUF6879 family protein [Pseudonocardiaceae bacterium]